VSPQGQKRNEKEVQNWIKVLREDHWKIFEIGRQTDPQKERVMRDEKGPGYGAESA